MIIPDVNVLVYAADETSVHHEAARTWWEQTLSSGTPVGLPWVVAMGFLRLVTSSRVVSDPYAVGEGMDTVDGWLEQPGVLVVGPGKRHAAVLRRLLAFVPSGGNAIPDAHIAAIAVEHDGTLWSADRGFARFQGLDWRDPLAAV